VGSQLGRFTQLPASNIVMPRQTIKAKTLLRRLVGVRKNLGKIDITKPSFLVDQFIMPLVLASQPCLEKFPLPYTNRGQKKMQSELIGRTGLLVGQRTMAERIKPNPARSQAFLSIPIIPTAQPHDPPESLEHQCASVPLPF
jgi:hypothetical protein